jgi:hypothetical protein
MTAITGRTLQQQFKDFYERKDVREALEKVRKRKRCGLLTQAFSDEIGRTVSIAWIYKMLHQQYAKDIEVTIGNKKYCVEAKPDPLPKLPSFDPVKPPPPPSATTTPTTSDNLTPIDELLNIMNKTQPPPQKNSLSSTQRRPRAKRTTLQEYHDSDSN